MVLDDALQQRSEIDRLTRPMQAGRITRQHQQQREQLLQVAGGGADALKPRAHRCGRVRVEHRQVGGAGDHRVRRAQFVAGHVDEQPFALDETVVARKVVVERIADDFDLGRRVLRHLDALARAVRPQLADLPGHARERRDQAVRRPERQQPHHQEQGQRGTDHGQRHVMLAFFQIGDVESEHLARRAFATHQHDAFLAIDHHIVVDAGRQMRQRGRHRARRPVQRHVVRVGPAEAGIAGDALIEMVQLVVEQGVPDQSLRAFVEDQALHGHRDAQGRDIDQQAQHQAAAQARALAVRVIHRCHLRRCGSRCGPRCGSAGSGRARPRCGAVRRHASAAGRHRACRRPRARLPAVPA